MLEIATRRRPYVLLAVALVFQILLLAVQVRRPDGARLIRVWAVELLTPAERAGSWVLDKLSGGWSEYIGLFRANRENQRLREQVAELSMQKNALESRAAEAQRLQALLDFRDAHTDAPLLPARVIGGDAGNGGRAIYLDRGERDGVQANMGVITPQGVVGKVLEVYSTTSQVLLLTDKNGGAGALLADSRTQGATRGTGGPILQLDYVSNDQDVKPGERVLTSGMDRIFPKDLPLGTVVEVSPGNPFKQITVRPAAHLDQLEEVLILMARRQWEWQAHADASAEAGSAAVSASAKPGAPAAEKKPATAVPGAKPEPAAPVAKEKP
ncbi:MAG TPA: rod shape-determining protein MreC [Patescibacteria group bacterium]|nr:rod shape-determining protein MreC [Patescibacteria group bacterium]